MTLRNTSDYETEYTEIAEKIIRKLDKKQKSNIKKKVRQICSRPFGYKPLKGPLKGLFRVHVNKHFVLIFAIDHERRLVDIQNYAHHDEVYVS